MAISMHNIHYVIQSKRTGVIVATGYPLPHCREEWQLLVHDMVDLATLKSCLVAVYLSAWYQD